MGRCIRRRWGVFFWVEGFGHDFEIKNFGLNLTHLGSIWWISMGFEPLFNGQAWL